MYHHTPTLRTNLLLHPHVKAVAYILMDKSADVMKAVRIDYTQLRQWETPDKTFLTRLWTREMSLIGADRKSSKQKTTMHFTSLAAQLTMTRQVRPHRREGMCPVHLDIPLQHTTKRLQTEVLRINQYKLHVNKCEGRQISGFRREMRTAFFWVKTRRAAVISCRRFGTTYRSRNVLKELPLLAA